MELINYEQQVSLARKQTETHLGWIYLSNFKQDECFHRMQTIKHVVDILNPNDLGNLIVASVQIVRVLLLEPIVNEGVIKPKLTLHISFCRLAELSLGGLCGEVNLFPVKFTFQEIY